MDEKCTDMISKDVAQPDYSPESYTALSDDGIALDYLGVQWAGMLSLVIPKNGYYLATFIYTPEGEDYTEDIDRNELSWFNNHSLGTPDGVMGSDGKSPVIQFHVKASKKWI